MPYRTGRTRRAVLSDEADGSDESDEARCLIGRVGRVGRVGRRDDLSDGVAVLSDEGWALSDEADGWGRVEKIGYIYQPGACGRNHRMVVGDHFAKVFVEIYYE